MVRSGSAIGDGTTRTYLDACFAPSLACARRPVFTQRSQVVVSCASSSCPAGDRRTVRTARVRSSGVASPQFASNERERADDVVASQLVQLGATVSCPLTPVSRCRLSFSLAPQFVRASVPYLLVNRASRRVPLMLSRNPLEATILLGSTPYCFLNTPCAGRDDQQHLDVPDDRTYRSACPA